MATAGLVFYYLALVMIISAFFTVVSHNPVHAILFLLVMIIHQALMLYLLGSEFLGAVQIIVYAGAVVVLFLFVVYLVNVGKEERLKVFVRRASLGLIFLFVFVLLFLKNFSLFLALNPRVQKGLTIEPSHPETLKTMARYLFTEYLFPFEVIGVILLVVILGAVFILKKVKEDSLG